MYSIENLPDKCPNANKIQLTPRSDEALKRTGYDTEDLFEKN